jgi:glycerol-3-phosphate dehydrogenase
MLTIAGGKLTTYRSMSAQLVDHAVAALHALDGRAKPPAAATDTEPLPGGEVHDLEPLGSAGLELGLPIDTVDHIVQLFGAECAAVFNLVQEDRALARPLSAGYPAIEAEVVHVTRRELARRVEDVLVRRLHLYYETRDHGASAARRTAELMGLELGWEPARIMEETARYATLASTTGVRRD